MFLYYPDFDSNVARWSLLFNQKLEPRPLVKPLPNDLNILFCYERLLPSSVTFKHNHYVPLISGAIATKRKSSSSFPKSKKPCNFQSKLSFKPSISNQHCANVSETVPTELLDNRSFLTSMVTPKGSHCIFPHSRFFYSLWSRPTIVGCWCWCICLKVSLSNATKKQVWCCFLQGEG